LAPERRDPHRMLDNARIGANVPVSNLDEAGDTRAAWLKDPDGNILEIVGA
jgi:hypothetical protein